MHASWCPCPRPQLCSPISSQTRVDGVSVVQVSLDRQGAVEGGPRNPLSRKEPRRQSDLHASGERTNGRTSTGLKNEATRRMLGGYEVTLEVFQPPARPAGDDDRLFQSNQAGARRGHLRFVHWSKQPNRVGISSYRDRPVS